jgi:hypothetical protein
VLYTRPGDLIGYNIAPGEYYWIIFGTDENMWALRMDRKHDRFVPYGAPYPTDTTMLNHHLIHRSRP